MPRAYSTPALRAEHRTALAVAGTAVRIASDSAAASEEGAALQATFDAQAETISNQATMLAAIDARVHTLETP